MEEKKQPRIKILVACHKADPNIRQDDIYMPIQVGKALHPELDLGFQCDNTGDNISEKNGSYCELTALYWAWKNLKDVDYIGLCHYRRYFGFSFKSLPYQSTINITENYFKGTITEKYDIAKVFDKYDIILAKPYSTPFSLEVEYNYAHIKNDFVILETVVKELYPEYIKSFNKIFYHNNQLSAYNMFLTSTSIFEEYCKWLFKILSEVECRVKLSQYTDQARIFGYMAERLFNVYVLHNNLKALYVPVLKIDNAPNFPYWKIFLCHIRNKISSWMTYSR